MEVNVELSSPPKISKQQGAAQVTEATGMTTTVVGSNAPLTLALKPTAFTGAVAATPLPSAIKSTVTARPRVGTLKPPTQNLPIELQNNQNRRSSSRSIKRKRFDDEIVEYSVNFPQSRGDPHRMRRPSTISTATPHTLPAPLPTLPQVTLPPPPAEVIFTPEVAAPTPPITSLPTVAAVPTASSSHLSNLSTLPSFSGASTSAVATTSTAPLNIPPQNTPPADRTTAIKQGQYTDRRRIPRGGNRRARKSGRPPNMTTTRDLGRWKPIDDLALIIGVQQTNDLRTVLRGVKFSSKFTFSELQTRWFALMYDPTVSRLATAAMRNLSTATVQSVQRKALFSTQEETVLGTFKSSDNPKLEQFQELLDKNATVFFCSRTAKALQNHWQLMKVYQLLPDQVIKPPNPDEPLSFSDAEDLIVDSELNDQRDEALEIELSLADRQHKREIRLLENELHNWNVLVDSIAGVGLTPEFDSQTLATLRGSHVRYLMRSKEITFGRDAKDTSVDVDLSLEGPSFKISRRQGTIKMRSNGDFFIANEGKRPLFIDGVPLLAGTKTRLSNQCRVEICGLRFVFQVNYDLINAIRHESAKSTTILN